MPYPKFMITGSNGSKCHFQSHHPKGLNPWNRHGNSGSYFTYGIKNPALWRGFVFDTVACQAAFLRLPNPTSPTRAVPNTRMAAGTGTGTAGSGGSSG